MSTIDELKESIERKKSLFKQYDKKAMRYSKLSISYLKKYQEQSNWNNLWLREIEQLEAQVYQLQKQEGNA